MMTEEELQRAQSNADALPLGCGRFRDDCLQVLKDVRDLQASLKRHQDKLLKVSAKHVAAEKMAEQLAQALEELVSNIPMHAMLREEAAELVRDTIAAYRAWKERGATAKAPAKWMTLASAIGALFEVADEIRGQWKDREADHTVRQSSMYDLNWAVDWVGQTAEAMDAQPLPDCDIEGLREWVSRMGRAGHLDASGCREFNSLFDVAEALLEEPQPTEREDGS